MPAQRAGRIRGPARPPDAAAPANCAHRGHDRASGRPRAPALTRPADAARRHRPRRGPHPRGPRGAKAPSRRRGPWLCRGRGGGGGVRGARRFRLNRRRCAGAPGRAQRRRRPHSRCRATSAVHPPTGAGALVPALPPARARPARPTALSAATSPADDMVEGGGDAAVPRAGLGGSRGPGGRGVRDERRGPRAGRALEPLARPPSRHRPPLQRRRDIRYRTRAGRRLHARLRGHLPPPPHTPRTRTPRAEGVRAC